MQQHAQTVPHKISPPPCRAHKKDRCRCSRNRTKVDSAYSLAIGPDASSRGRAVGGEWGVRGKWGGVKQMWNLWIHPENWPPLGEMRSCEEITHVELKQELGFQRLGSCCPRRLELLRQLRRSSVVWAASSVTAQLSSGSPGLLKYQLKLTRTIPAWSQSKLLKFAFFNSSVGSKLVKRYSRPQR